MKHIAVSILVVFTIIGFAHAVAAKAFPLPGHGSIILSVPDGWADQIRQPAGGLPPTLIFTPGPDQATDMQFLVLVTPVWKGPNAPADYGTMAFLRPIVDGSAQAMQDKAAEPVLALKPFGGANKGFYFSATDKAWKPGVPGNYKILNQGALFVGELMTTFTFLTNDTGSDVVKRALDMLIDARHKP